MCRVVEHRCGQATQTHSFIISPRHNGTRGWDRHRAQIMKIDRLYSEYYYRSHSGWEHTKSEEVWWTSYPLINETPQIYIHVLSKTLFFQLISFTRKIKVTGSLDFFSLFFADASEIPVEATYCESAWNRGGNCISGTPPRWSLSSWTHKIDTTLGSCRLTTWN